MSEEAPACRSDPDARARAMAYIQEVQKRLLPERDETYQQFLRLFSDYISGKSLEQTRNNAKELLKDDPDLIEGFEKFLPVNDLKKVEDKGAEGSAVQ